MVDPAYITNFKLTDDELEEVLLFWVLVSGKTAKTTSGLLEKLLSRMRQWHKGRLCPSSPFAMIRNMHRAKLAKGEIDWLTKLMKEVGIGCYSSKSRGFIELAFSTLNLRTCTVDDLEKICSIGMKTSRCFIMHSRKDANHAGLDVHILKWLRDQGYDVPKQTPASKKQYLEIEKTFIKLASRHHIPIADFDLKIWRQYSGN